MTCPAKLKSWTHLGPAAITLSPDVSSAGTDGGCASRPLGTAAAFAAAIDDLPGHLVPDRDTTLGLEVHRAAIALRFNERRVATRPTRSSSPQGTRC